MKSSPFVVAQCGTTIAILPRLSIFVKESRSVLMLIIVKCSQIIPGLVCWIPI